MVELFAGLAAVTQAAFGLEPPCSRHGCKTGYAKTILRHLELDDVRPDYCLLVDSDPSLVAALRDLFHRPKQLAAEVDQLAWRSNDPKVVWEEARAERDGSTAAWWLACAGSFRGVGFYRGEHKHRPNLDGFSPSREELIRRIAARPSLEEEVGIVCMSAMDVELMQGAAVYMDPEYEGTSKYSGTKPFDIELLAYNWSEIGSKVAVSEGKKLELPGFDAFEITNERRGQSRKDSVNSREFLMVSRRP